MWCVGCCLIFMVYNVVLAEEVLVVGCRIIWFVAMGLLSTGLSAAPVKMAQLQSLQDDFTQQLEDTSTKINANITAVETGLRKGMRQYDAKIAQQAKNSEANLQALQQDTAAKFDQLQARLQATEKNSDQRLGELNESLQKNLQSLEQDTHQKIQSLQKQLMAEIEKLVKRIDKVHASR